ncbi:MAG TPA: penicillin-binding protein activator [Kiloniellales bacterium]|nr:penicillin-binding protein activator [Kiloniellales bacterium]
MTTSRLAVSAIAAAMAFLLAACGGSQATREAALEQPQPEVMLPEEEARSFFDEGHTRVALLVPLSGEHAQVGQAIVNASQMALFDIADNDFALTVKDTGSAAGGATAALQEALDEGADLILGPLFASDARAITPAATNASVPLLTFSNDQSLARPGIYVMGLTAHAEVDRVIDHAARNGLRRVGLLMPQTPYGEAVRNALEEATQRYGGELVEIVGYNPRSPDFSKAVRDFAQRGGVSQGSGGRYDAVLVPAADRELLSLAAQLAYHNVNPNHVQYLGTRLWEDLSISTEPSLMGGWFAAPSRASWERFVERYRSLYDARPPRITSIAYDTTALAAAIAQDAANNGSDLVFTPQALQDSDGFAGVDGLFRLRPDGTVERGLAVYEVQRDAFVEREAAPQSFVPLIN